MTVARTVGDVVRLTRPHGFGKRNKCPHCNQLLRNGEVVLCTSCGIVYGRFCDDDYQVVGIDPV
jgi:hypothetical protein